ncbi:MAG: hypothetical protein JW818_12705 [Pirellulales bacterium]|nr:hypothetical protein [Pirellulales bacterium]
MVRFVSPDDNPECRNGTMTADDPVPDRDVREARPSRRRYQFTLWTLLVTVTVAAVLMGIWMTFWGREKPRKYYSKRELVKRLRFEGLTVLLWPKEQGPYAIGSGICSSGNEDILAGRFTFQDGKKIQIRYPTYRLSLCARPIILRNGDRTHLLAAYAKEDDPRVREWIEKYNHEQKKMASERERTNDGTLGSQ